MSASLDIINQDQDLIAPAVILVLSEKSGATFIPDYGTWYATSPGDYYTDTPHCLGSNHLDVFLALVH